MEEQAYTSHNSQVTRHLNSLCMGLRGPFQNNLLRTVMKEQTWNVFLNKLHEIKNNLGILNTCIT